MTLQFNPYPIIQPRTDNIEAMRNMDKTISNLGDSVAQSRKDKLAMAIQQQELDRKKAEDAWLNQTPGSDVTLGMVDADHQSPSGMTQQNPLSGQQPMGQQPAQMPSFGGLQNNQAPTQPQPMPNQGLNPMLASAGTNNVGIAQPMTQPQGQQGSPLVALSGQTDWSQYHPDNRPKPMLGNSTTNYPTPMVNANNTPMTNFQKMKNMGMQEQELKLKTGQQQYNQASQMDDQNSSISNAYKRFAGQIMPGMDLSGTSATDLAKLEPMITAYQNKLLATEMRKQTLGLTTGVKEDQRQDKLEGQAIQRVTGLRGDKSLSDAEVKRDAAITVYNTISKYQGSNTPIPRPVYYDLLGQMWKARTGSAPTDQSIRDLDQNTAKGDIGKAYTFFTGQTAPATSDAVIKSIQQFAIDSGEQADKLHEGYMKTHLIKPTGLDEDRWQPILNTGRGTSFKEATGYMNIQSGGSNPPPAPEGTTQVLKGVTYEKRGGKWLQK